MHFENSLIAQKIHLGCIWMQKKCSPTRHLCDKIPNFYQLHTVMKKSRILKNSQKFSKCYQNVIKMSQKFSNQNFSKILKKFSKVLKCTSKMSQKCNSTVFFCHSNDSQLNVTSICKDIQHTISFCSKKSKVLKSSQKKSRMSMSEPK